MALSPRPGTAVPDFPVARAAPVAWVTAVARDLAGLVVPVECAGCGRLDVALCDACRARLAGPPWRCEDAAGRLDRLGRAPLPVWTLTPYTGPVRELVVAWKDRGRLDVTPLLADALAAAARDVAGVLERAGVTVGVRPLWVVPAPSSASARRRRGVDLVAVLAAAVARGCREAGLPAVAAPVLAQRPGAKDQVGLSARDRRSNVRGRVRRRRTSTVPLPGQPVLLVDDVLTTGATLAACDDVLRGAGARVVAGLTVAATPAPGRAVTWRTPGAQVTVSGRPDAGPR
jgi:predicted amidophosphoribosyltransferase